MKMPITKTELGYFIIFFCALAAVFALNVFVGSMLTSPAQLAEGLASPPDSPQSWSIQDWSTVKYRALFRITVQGVWSWFFASSDAQGFYLTFVALSFLIFYGTVIALYFFLRELSFDPRTSFIGGLFFLVSPPVLLAYRYPIYTREDPLAFLLLVVGLIAVVRSNLFWVCLISIAAALTRETTLIMPLAYALASKQSWGKRILVAVVPVLALIGIRLAWGNTIPDSLNSSVLNFTNLGETSAFMFCTFGALWLPYLISLVQRWRHNDARNHAWSVIISTAPIVLALVLVATLSISRAREIRITFILFPWAIALALDWFVAHRVELQQQVRQLAFWVFGLGIFGALSALTLYFHLTNPDLMRYYLADFKNGYWLFIGVVNLAVMLTIFLPKPWRTISIQSNARETTT